MADMVNHPPHYQGANGLEAIDVIEVYDLGYHLGNAFKYLVRAGRKGSEIEDLKKARWYLARWRSALDVGSVDVPEPRVGIRQWYTPIEIAEGFALTGFRSAACVALLSGVHPLTAGTSKWLQEGVAGFVDEAIGSLDREIARLEAGE